LVTATGKLKRKPLIKFQRPKPIFLSPGKPPANQNNVRVSVIDGDLLIAINNLCFVYLVFFPGLQTLMGLKIFVVRAIKARMKNNFRPDLKPYVPVKSKFIVSHVYII